MFYEAYSTPDANANYAKFTSQLDKVLSSWNMGQGAKTQAIGDEVHVEGLLRGDRMKKNFEHFI